MLAGLASAATHPFPVGDPPVELGAFEGLGRAVVAGQLGQLAGELGGQVAGLAAGQPLTQHRQGGPGRLLGVLAGVEPAPFLDLLDELVERHAAIPPARRSCGASDRALSP
jgi:hypothetical protein